MTYATCPYCHNRYCPAIGRDRHLCSSCGRIYTHFPSKLHSQVKATSTLFRIRLAKILEE